MQNNEIVIFETEDKLVTLPVAIENETVWLSANQMAVLFGRDEKTIRKHINNVFSEDEVDKNNNTQKMRVDGVKQLVPFYTLDVIISVGYRVKSKRGVEFRSEDEVDKNNNTQKMRVDGVKQLVPFYTLDVIISVGYRVKSKRGVEFRCWANSVLKQYILKGYAVNDNRIKQLGEVIRIMKRTEDALDSKQVLSVIEKYSSALDLLDAYDHQNMMCPEGNQAIYVLSYEECMEVIQSMRFGDESDLFGKEKDDSFKGSIGNIYQSFGGVDIYQSLEEKAANLL